MGVRSDPNPPLTGFLRRGAHFADLHLVEMRDEISREQRTLGRTRNRAAQEIAVLGLPIRPAIAGNDRRGELHSGITGQGNRVRNLRVPVAAGVRLLKIPEVLTR